MRAVPTPAVPLLIRQHGAAGGVMVSASHNPPGDNGIKVFGANGAKLSPSRQAQIEAGLRGDLDLQGLDTAVYGQSRPSMDLLDGYRQALLASVGNNRLDGVPIVLDLCWGSATACAAEAFQALGADLTVLHGEPDGAQINVACGSTQLDPLRRAVIEREAAMGFAFEVMLIGCWPLMVRAVSGGDHVLFLWGSVAGPAAAGSAPGTVMSNLGFERAWQQRGGQRNEPQSATSMCMPPWWPAVRHLAVSSPATSWLRPMASVVMACSPRFSSPRCARPRAWI